MENKEIKKEVNSKAPTFKRLSELKYEDVKVLPRTVFTVTKNQFNGNSTYRGSVPFGLTKLNCKLDETTVWLLASLKDMDRIPNEFTLPATIRFVKGINKNGNTYHQAQIIVSNDLYFTSFVNDGQLKLEEKWEQAGKMQKINWLESVTNEVEDGIGYFEDK